MLSIWTSLKFCCLVKSSMTDACRFENISHEEFSVKSLYNQTNHGEAQF